MKSFNWKTATAAANEVVPEEDVIVTKEDGRQIVVARAGSPLTRAAAIKYGLIEDEKAEAGKPNKSAKAAENKSEKAAEK
jgi:hypothetical protein